MLARGEKLPFCRKGRVIIFFSVTCVFPKQAVPLEAGFRDITHRLLHKLHKSQGILLHPLVVEEHAGWFPLCPGFQLAQIRISIAVRVAAYSVQAEVLKVSELRLIFERIDAVDQLKVPAKLYS